MVPTTCPAFGNSSAGVLLLKVRYIVLPAFTVAPFTSLSVPVTVTVLMPLPVTVGGVAVQAMLVAGPKFVGAGGGVGDGGGEPGAAASCDACQLRSNVFRQA